MRVVEPEVERHHRGLDQESGDHQRERGDDERVGPAGQRRRELREAEPAGARVEDPDPGQREVGAEGVDDAERERALHGRRVLDLESGQGVGDRPHQLEEHEHVEQVLGQGEPVIPARNSNISAWKCASTESK